MKILILIYIITKLKEVLHLFSDIHFDLKTIWESDLGKTKRRVLQLKQNKFQFKSNDFQLLEKIDQNIQSFIRSYIKAMNNYKITDCESSEMQELWTSINGDLKIIDDLNNS